MIKHGLNNESNDEFSCQFYSPVVRPHCKSQCQCHKSTDKPLNNILSVCFHVENFPQFIDIHRVGPLRPPTTVPGTGAFALMPLTRVFRFTQIRITRADPDRSW